ncbi:NAD-dependent deacetylase sirtuin-7 [Xylariaceae sp. FL1272]|nr:NAD-dependent deacetylase sirtuin-7 [Xylariaceae sp. FL1272]
MADTAPKVAERERQESPNAVDSKAETIARLMKESRHFIVFTGAGVSTSAGISDFRGPNGVWTLRAQGKAAQNKKSTLQAIPTPTHMALVELQKRGILTYLISQNCDGLHRRSGIPPNKISELHGNSNREYCQNCEREYLRDFRAVSTYENSIHDHRTGRKCAVCGGDLLDTIINFGENLWEEPIRLAREHADKADLCLVLGSSLTVTPASEIPEPVGRRRGAQLVICNLQSTPKDRLCDIRVFAKGDDLMTRIMAKLEIPVPKFILRRRLIVETKIKDGRPQLTIEGVDIDGIPATFLQSVKLDYNRRTIRSEPFTFNLRSSPNPGTQLEFELEFMGHYGEPNLEVAYEYHDERDTEAFYLLEYNPENGKWVINQVENLGPQDQAQTRTPKRDRVVLDLTGDDSPPESILSSPAVNAL